MDPFIFSKNISKWTKEYVVHIISTEVEVIHIYRSSPLQSQLFISHFTAVAYLPPKSFVVSQIVCKSSVGPLRAKKNSKIDSVCVEMLPF